MRVTVYRNILWSVVAILSFVPLSIAAAAHPPAAAESSIAITSPEDEQTDPGIAPLPKPDAVAVSPGISRSVTVVYPEVMPPYTFRDDAGEAQGLAVDILRLWSQKTGIAIRWESAPWEKGLQRMREGKADIHASLYYTEERDAFLDYATIVAPSAGGIFFHKSILDVNGPESLTAFRVGVVRGGFHERYAQTHLPKVALVSYPEFPEMVTAAQNGEIRVFIDDLGATLYRLKAGGLIDAYRYHPEKPLYRNNFWIAVRQGDTALSRELIRGMAQITPEARAAIERKWLGDVAGKTRDTLVIAIASNFYPYAFINAEGRAAGLFVDIWRLWSEKTGREIEFRADSWSESLNHLKTGGADIHFGLFYSDTRADWLDYAAPHYETGSCFFYAHDQKPGDDPGGYAGKKVGVVRGSYQEEYLRSRYPEVDLVSFTTQESLLRAVESHDISACLSEYLSTKALIDRLGLSGVFNADVKILFRKEFHPGVLKGNAELLSLVERGFDNIESKELAEIESRWVADSEMRYYAALSQRTLLTKQEQAWLEAHPDIVLGFTDVVAPAVIVNPDGTYSGFLVDFYDALNKRLNSRIRLRIDSIPVALLNAKTKQTDGIANLHPAYADKLGLLKTHGFMPAYPVVFGRRDISFKGPAEFEGKTVAAMDQVYFSEEILRPYRGRTTIFKVKDALEGLQRVDRGEADFFLGISPNSYLLAKYHLFRLAPQYLFYDYPVKFGGAVRPDWPELVSILNKGIASFSQNEIDAIVAKWVRLEVESKVIAMTAAEKAWIQNHPEVTVFVTASEWPPFIVFEKGEPAGIAMDYIRLICGRLGVKPVFVPGREADAVGRVEKGEGPYIFPIIRKRPDHETTLLFSQDLCSFPLVIFTRTDSSFIGTITDLRGRSVSVEKGAVPHPVLKEKALEIEIKEVDGGIAALRDLSAGRVDAHIGSLAVGSYLIMNHGLPNLKVAAPTDFPPTPLSIAVGKDHAEFAAVIRKAIDTIAPEEHMRIRQKWLAVHYEQGIRTVAVVKWVLAVAGIGVVALLIVLIWNRSLRRIIRSRTADLLEYQGRLKALASQLTVAESKERKTLAADLHDHIGHSLVLSRMQLEGILEAESSVERKLLVKDISGILLKALQDVRGMIFELGSPSMNKDGLGAALSEWLENQVEGRFGLKTAVYDHIRDEHRKKLDEDMRVLLFRSVKELVNNVVKHARAGKVDIYLSEEDADLKIVVADDGVGFDPEAESKKIKKVGGFGLFSIQERMSNLGGSFEIQSEPGKGCRATLTVPFETARENR